MAESSHAQEAGSEPVLQKPFDPLQLLSTIDSVLSRANLSALR